MNDKERKEFREKQEKELKFLKNATLEELKKAGYKIEKVDDENKNIREYIKLFD